MSDNALVKAAQTGDKSACAALWAAVRKHGLFIANRYKTAVEANMAVSADDMEQIAALAMLEALITWKQDSGYSFLNWFSFYVQNGMREALGLRGRNRAEHYRQISLYTPIPGSDEDLTIADTIADETLPEMTAAIEQQELRQDINAALAKLPAIERRVVQLHDLQGHPLPVMGPEANKQRRRAFAKLRKDARLRARCASYAFQHKGLSAFKTTFTSVVEDTVIRIIDK